MRFTICVDDAYVDSKTDLPVRCASNAAPRFLFVCHTVLAGQQR